MPPPCAGAYALSQTCGGPVSVLTTSSAKTCPIPQIQSQANTRWLACSTSRWAFTEKCSVLQHPKKVLSQCGNTSTEHHSGLQDRCPLSPASLQLWCSLHQVHEQAKPEWLPAAQQQQHQQLRQLQQSQQSGVTSYAASKFGFRRPQEGCGYSTARAERVVHPENGRVAPQVPHVLCW